MGNFFPEVCNAQKTILVKTALLCIDFKHTTSSNSHLEMLEKRRIGYSDDTVADDTEIRKIGSDLFSMPFRYHRCMTS